MPSVGDKPKITKSHVAPTTVNTDSTTVGSTTATKGTAKVAPVEAKKKPEALGKAAVHSTVPQAKFNDAVAPALNRAFFTLASKIETGDAAANIAAEAAREFAKSPEAMAAFKHALPYLEAGAVKLGSKVGVEAIGKVATNALPLLADGKMVKALLKAGQEVGGPSGRRLVGAAIRGLNTGKGMAGASAEVAATAAKIGAKSGALGGTAAKGLSKALPVVGNALNVLAVGSSLKALYDAVVHGPATTGQICSRVLHTAATVTGCFIPPVGAVAVAIDVKDIVAPPGAAPAKT
ncbi:MAG: hypothetical protein JNK82_05620 [Myxococcaceae bacterium]|nr:hypothetical protein [Myxococcaceae bacterium]